MSPETSDRCDATSPAVRLSLVSLAREAVHEGRRHVGPDYAHEYRCSDRAACLDRTKARLAAIRAAQGLEPMAPPPAAAPDEEVPPWA